MENIVSRMATLANPIPASSIEDLVSDHFDRIFVIIEAFVGDHKQSLRHAEVVFRVVEETSIMTLAQVYRTAAETVRRLPDRGLLPSGAAVEGTLCLLYKEVGGFRYAEISDLLDMDPQDVKAGIARARTGLLAA